LGGRDQKDFALKPAWANSSRDPISKIPITKKKRLVEQLKVKVLSASSSTMKKKKKLQLTLKKQITTNISTNM
jgi:hypothetical protein